MGALTSKFNKGERSEEFLKHYISSLKKARMTDQVGNVVCTVLNESGRNNWTEINNWMLFKTYVNTLESPVTDYFLSNHKKYTKALGQEEVDAKIESLYLDNAKKLLTRKKGEEAKIDREGFEKLKSSLSTYKIKQKEDIILEAELYFAFRPANWDKYVELVENKLEKDKNVINTSLFGWALKMVRFCRDEDKKAIAKEWITLVSKKAKSEKIQKRAQRYIDDLNNPDQRRGRRVKGMRPML